MVLVRITELLNSLNRKKCNKCIQLIWNCVIQNVTPVLRSTPNGVKLLNVFCTVYFFVF